jgi:hypothetical protein
MKVMHCANLSLHLYFVTISFHEHQFLFSSFSYPAQFEFVHGIGHGDKIYGIQLVSQKGNLMKHRPNHQQCRGLHGIGHGDELYGIRLVS